MIREEIENLLLEMDRVECEMRAHEHRLYRIRHRLAELAGLRPGTFGFTEEGRGSRDDARRS